MEKKQYMQRHLDSLRKLLMNEPRGHQDMFGAMITDPCDPGCDIGLIFMDANGYLDMCGHGTMGSVTSMINTGMLPSEKKEILVDTPAGVVKCQVKTEKGRVSKVTITNVPSFVFAEQVKIDVDELGPVTLDIAFGGSIFGIVDASQFGLNLVPKEQKKLIQLGQKIKHAANQKLHFQHPEKPEICEIKLIEFSLEIQKGVHYRNAVIFGDGQLDRSPCGTGTCAKMAVLYKQGELAKDQTFVHQSVIGSTFEGRVLESTDIGNFKGIVPEITGAAWITGMHQFIIEEEDPFKEGFLLK